MKNGNGKHEDIWWREGLRDEILNSIQRLQEEEGQVSAAEVAQMPDRPPRKAYTQLVQFSKQLSGILPRGITCFLDEGQGRSLHEGDEPCVVEVISGYVSLNVRGRERVQSRNIAVIASPMIIGLHQLMPWSDRKLTTVVGFHGGAQLRLIPVSELEKALDTHHYWEILARMEALSNSYFLYMHALLHPCNAYEMVRELLIHMAEGECNILRRTNATDFISMRSGLSRSSVAGILGILNRRGYIRMVQGKVEYIGVLPDKIKQP